MFALPAPDVFSGVLDRVVAFVDDEAITLGELKEAYERAKENNGDSTETKVLNGMINRALLLGEARRLRMEAPDEEETIREYIDLKLRVFVKVSEEDVRNYYEENKDRLGGRDFDSLKDMIERLLDEKELNKRLKGHIEDLRTKSYIKVFYPETGP